VMFKPDGGTETSRIENFVTTTTRETLRGHLRDRKDQFYRAMRGEGFEPVEFLDRASDTYSPGDHDFVFAVLSGAVGIDEEALSWEQVREFRKDIDAFDDYRRLVEWFDEDIEGAGQRQAEDKLIGTCERAGVALKKHGVKTAIGVLGIVIPTSLGTVLAETFAPGSALLSMAGGAGGVELLLYKARLEKKEMLMKGPLATEGRQPDQESHHRRGLRPSQGLASHRRTGSARNHPVTSASDTEKRLVGEGSQSSSSTYSKGWTGAMATRFRSTQASEGRERHRSIQEDSGAITPGSVSWGQRAEVMMGVEILNRCWNLGLHDRSRS